MKGSLAGVETLCFNNEFFEGSDDVPAVIEALKKGLPNLKVLTAMFWDADIKSTLEAMPGITALCLEQPEMYGVDLTGVLRPGMQHLRLCGQVLNDKQLEDLIEPSFLPLQLESLELDTVTFPNVEAMQKLLTRLPALRSLRLESIHFKQLDSEAWAKAFANLAARPGLALETVGGPDRYFEEVVRATSPKAPAN